MIKEQVGSLWEEASRFYKSEKLASDDLAV